MKKQVNKDGCLVKLSGPLTKCSTFSTEISYGDFLVLINIIYIYNNIIVTQRGSVEESLSFAKELIFHPQN